MEGKPIPGYDGKYHITRDGRVLTQRRKGSPGGELKAQIRPDGYAMVLLRRPGQKKVGATIHRLVAAAFIGPCPEGYDVRHKDGSRANNHVDNLEYGTRADNMADARKHGTLAQGEHHAFARLTEDDVRAIRARYQRGIITQKTLGDEFGVGPKAISDIILRKRWKHI